MIRSTKNTQARKFEPTCSLIGVRAATAGPETGTELDVDSGEATGGYEVNDIEDKLNVDTRRRGILKDNKRAMRLAAVPSTESSFWMLLTTPHVYGS
jgi:hypothetical protein